MIRAVTLAWLLFIAVPGFTHPGAVDDSGCHLHKPSGTRHCHPERARSSIVYDERRPPRPGDEGVLYGPFVNLSDGDTFHAKVQGVVMEFRLSDVDAPEHDQPYGSSARDELRSLIAGEQLTFVFVDVDRYGRIVAQVWVEDIDVGRELIRRGAAWFYAAYARDNSLFEVEERARKAKLGLWAEPAKDRMEPWVWRARRRRGDGGDDGHVGQK